MSLSQCFSILFFNRITWIFLPFFLEKLLKVTSPQQKEERAESSERPSGILYPRASSNDSREGVGERVVHLGLSRVPRQAPNKSKSNQSSRPPPSLAVRANWNEKVRGKQSASETREGFISLKQINRCLLPVSPGGLRFTITLYKPQAGYCLGR